jgi:hypothetical protein
MFELVKAIGGRHSERVLLPQPVPLLLLLLS